MIFCWFLSLLLVQRAQLGQAGNSFFGNPHQKDLPAHSIRKYKYRDANANHHHYNIFHLSKILHLISPHPFLLVILVVDVWEGSLLWVTLNLKKRFSNFLLIKLNRFELVCHFGTKIFSFELRKVLVPTLVERRHLLHLFIWLSEIETLQRGTVVQVHTIADWIGSSNEIKSTLLSYIFTL